MILSVLETADILLIGPGLGTTPESFDLLELILAHQTKKQWLIMDGSALTLFAKEQLELPYPKQTVFTPHQMEWQRLTSLAIADQTKEKNSMKQRELGTTVVLKSHQTTIYGQKMIYQNTIGSAAMATGGMGILWQVRLLVFSPNSPRMTRQSQRLSIFIAISEIN